MNGIEEGAAHPPRPAAPGIGRERMGGPLGVRELGIFAVTLVALIGTWLPLAILPGGIIMTAWSPMPWLVIPAVFPLLGASVLLLVRGLLPQRNWRVGSLSVDQFSSVAAVVTTLSGLGTLLFVLSVGPLAVTYTGGGVSLGAGTVLGVVAGVAAMALTTFAPVIPSFRREFESRPEAAAHPLARPAVRPVARTVALTEFGSLVPSGGWGAHASPRYRRTRYDYDDTPDAAWMAEEQTVLSAPVLSVTAPEDEWTEDGVEPGSAPLSASRHVSAEAGVTGLTAADRGELSEDIQPFWVLAPTTRPVRSEQTGETVFEIGPEAWALVVHRRGQEFVVRDESGRLGVVVDTGDFRRA